MSAADKDKLDGIAEGANKYTHPSYTAKSSGLYKITVNETGHVSGAEAIHTGRAARFVIGTSTAGWTADECDYLCDGTGDQTEINAAIAALPSWGGEVLLLDGTYNISSSITISKANVVLRGSGPSTVLKRMFNKSETNGVIGCSASNCRICDLVIDGNKYTYIDNDNNGIYASKSAAGIQIDHITVKNSYIGLRLTGMDGGSVSNCIVQTTSTYGLYISSVTNMRLEKNVVSGNGGDGIAVLSTEDIYILNNRITNTVDSGITIDSASKRGGVSCNICDETTEEVDLSINGSAFIVTENVVGKITLDLYSKSNIVAHNILTSKDVVNRGTNNLVESNKVFGTVK